METESHYFRVGLYIIGLVVGLAVFAIWLASSGIDNSRDYRVYFTESVSGLTVGSPVKYRGVNVGTVTDIAINKKRPSEIRVDVEIDGDTPVKVGTVASLKLQGITGTIYIELTGGDTGAPDLAEVSTQKIPVIPSEASSIQTIMSQLPQIIAKLSRFADQLHNLATDENVAAFNDTLRNLSALTGNLNMLTSETHSVLTQTRGNIIESTQQLSGAMNDVRRSSRSVRKVTDRVEENPSSLIFPSAEKGIPAP